MAEIRVAELTLKQLKDLVEVYVWNALREFGVDPDKDWEPDEELTAYLEAVQRGEVEVIPAEEVYRSLGLKD